MPEPSAVWIRHLKTKAEYDGFLIGLSSMLVEIAKMQKEVFESNYIRYSREKTLWSFLNMYSSLDILRYLTEFGRNLVEVSQDRYKPEWKLPKEVERNLDILDNLARFVLSQDIWSKLRNIKSCKFEL